MRCCFLLNTIYLDWFTSLDAISFVLLTQGEDIFDGSVREVKEETGVSLLHAFTFSPSSLWFTKGQNNPTLLWIMFFLGGYRIRPNIGFQVTTPNSNRIISLYCIITDSYLFKILADKPTKLSLRSQTCSLCAC